MFLCHQSINHRFLIFVIKDKKFLEFFFKRVKPNNTGQYEADFPYVSPCGRETNYIHCDDLPVVFSHLLAPDGSVVQDIAGYGGEECDSATEEGDGSEGCSHRDSEGTAEHDGSIEKDVSRRVKSMCPEPTPARSGSRHRSHKTVLSPTASLAYGGTHTLTVPFQPSKLCMLPASGRVYHAGPERLGGVGLVKSSLAIELSRFFVYEEGVGESGHPVGFRWRGRTWELDGTVLDQLAHVSAGSE